MEGPPGREEEKAFVCCIYHQDYIGNKNVLIKNGFDGTKLEMSAAVFIGCLINARTLSSA